MNMPPIKNASYFDTLDKLSGYKYGMIQVSAGSAPMKSLLGSFADVEIAGAALYITYVTSE